MCEAGPRLHRPGPPGCGPCREARKTMGDQESPKDRGRRTSAGDGLKGQEVGAPLTPQLGALGVTVSSGGRRMTTGSSPRPQHLRLSHLCPD